jgi:hypothetical protein
METLVPSKNKTAVGRHRFRVLSAAKESAAQPECMPTLLNRGTLVVRVSLAIQITPAGMAQFPVCRLTDPRHTHPRPALRAIRLDLSPKCAAARSHANPGDHPSARRPQSAENSLAREYQPRVVTRERRGGAGAGRSRGT